VTARIANRRFGLELSALAVATVAMVVVAGHDGSLVGQTARVLAVLGGALGTAWCIERGSVRARGFASFGAGLIAAGVGLGIAVPHVRKEQLGLLAYAGIAALVAGSVLLVAGAVTVARSVRGWQRVGESAAMVVVAVSWLYASGIAVAATNVPRTPLGSATPADFGLSYADVRFPASDGVTLSGWYVPSRNRAVVVVTHGAGSTRSSVLEQAAVLAEHGYGVLLFDARGHGRSGGRAMDFGWFGDQDIAGAVSYVSDRTDVDRDRVAVVGMSMGGEEAVGAAAADPRIKAVVAEGATGRVRADRAWLSQEYGVRGQLHELLDFVTYGLTDVLTDASPPISLRDAVTKAAPRPVLLITAGTVADEASAAAYIRGGSPRTVQVWNVPGAEHTDGLDARPDAWEARVTSFLGRALGT
jgi:pimeloyl-ACP methyl ester carboxylesterase